MCPVPKKGAYLHRGSRVFNKNKIKTQVPIPDVKQYQSEIEP